MSRYFIPNDSHDGMDEILFTTSVQAISTSQDRDFLSKELKDHFMNIDKEMLSSDSLKIKQESKSLDDVVSSYELKELSDSLFEGRIKIIISDVQPQAIPGKTILWIKTENGGKIK